MRRIPTPMTAPTMTATANPAPRTPGCGCTETTGNVANCFRPGAARTWERAGHNRRNRETATADAAPPAPPRAGRPAGRQRRKARPTPSAARRSRIRRRPPAYPDREDCGRARRDRWRRARDSFPDAPRPRRAERARRAKRAIPLPAMSGWARKTRRTPPPEEIRRARGAWPPHPHTAWENSRRAHRRGQRLGDHGGRDGAHVVIGRVALIRGGGGRAAQNAQRSAVGTVARGIGGAENGHAGF